MTKQYLSEHHNPKVEWGLVGINQAMTGKCGDRSIFQRFVGNAQIPQLIIGSKISENENWQYDQAVKYEAQNRFVEIPIHFWNSKVLITNLMYTTE